MNSLFNGFEIKLYKYFVIIKIFYLCAVGVHHLMENVKSVENFYKKLNYVFPITQKKSVQFQNKSSVRLNVIIS